MLSNAKVRVLPSPFKTKKSGPAPAAEIGPGGPVSDHAPEHDLRSWQAIGKPPVNSAIVKNIYKKPLASALPKTGYFLGVDWFEATLRGPFATVDLANPERPSVNSAFEVPGGHLPGKILLYHNQASRRNKHYRFGFDVLFVPSGSKETANRTAMLGEYKIAVVSTVPHQGNILDPDSSIFQTENHLLYRHGLWETLDATFAALDVEVSHLTRLDVALDGHGLLDAPSTYYRDIMEVEYGRKSAREYEKLGRADYESCKNGKTPRNWQTGEDGNIIIFYVGGNNSKKCLNGYAKGQRIETENKQYIRAAWQAAGIIPVDGDGLDVARLEVRHRKEALDELNLLDKATGELHPFDWRKLRDGQYLAGLFKETLRNFYGFKIINPTDKDKSRWEDLQTIDWEMFDTARVVRISRTRNPSETWRAKHCVIKFLRDHAAGSYISEAIKEAIKTAPAYFITDEQEAALAEQITEENEGIDLAAAQRIVGLLVPALAADALDHVTAWTAEELPAAMAWAVADEHNIRDYIERVLQRDSLENGMPPIHKIYSPSIIAATAKRMAAIA